MKNFYVSSKRGISGICKYSADFYELVMKERGYTFVDSNERTSEILTTISSRDRVHIEIGIFQKKEIELLFLMLKANYKHVSVTLHDAPIIKYPFHEFGNQFFNNISKFYDKYGNGMESAIPLIRKIEAVYVLTHKGVEAVKNKYKIDHVYYLPHIINPREVSSDHSFNRNLLYFGFIGKNKGIEYSLQLHQQLITRYPDINFHVIGRPIGREVTYYKYLQSKYEKNVIYHGYVEERKLKEVFDQAMFAMIPFKDYKFFWPVSGSILYSLKKGKIVFTNDVNCISELIEDRKTGFFLSGNIRKDSERMFGIFDDQSLLSTIKDEANRHVLVNHSPEFVKSALVV